ncbi:MAG: hypothetical protein OXT06_25775 [Rhodospirillaceae bacterium]|nr:hypothetical protein [Rhodospirillaceae bacterium]MDD9914912.1 hypothetical protein [Rhodospirillaceae bacterium]MDD9927035.1 hypothetical protein [Rhodospirillaceae bacterium]
MEILDPTHEADAGGFALASRLSALQGATVGIISNGKKNTIPFFDAFESELKETYGVAEVVRRTKSNYSAPADAHLVEEAQGWDAVVAGIGD